jgi:hypothetical protein
LVFEVELLNIKKNAGNAPASPDQQPGASEKKPAGS